jgi:hypothetical protein
MLLWMILRSISVRALPAASVMFSNPLALSPLQCVHAPEGGT